MSLPRTYFCTHICFSYSSLFIPAVHTEHVWTIRGHCYTHSYIINTQTWRLSSPLCSPEAEKPRVHSYGTSTNCTERHLRCQSNLRFHLNIPESRNPVLIQSQSSSVQISGAYFFSFSHATQVKSETNSPTAEVICDWKLIQSGSLRTDRQMNQVFKRPQRWHVNMNRTSQTFEPSQEAKEINNAAPLVS